MGRANLALTRLTAIAWSVSILARSVALALPLMISILGSACTYNLADHHPSLWRMASAACLDTTSTKIYRTMKFVLTNAKRTPAWHDRAALS
jgi:hypothetical protein